MYDQTRATKREREFLAAMRRIRTAFFRNNSEVDRTIFERDVLSRLDNRFKKNSTLNRQRIFRGAFPASAVAF